MPCAGLLIAPADADPGYWPLAVPEAYRHCDVLWNERIRSGMHRAEGARARWRAGLARETARVCLLAATNDPRYRRMTDSDLRLTALWRWRQTGATQAMRRSEAKSQRQAETYLAVLEWRRGAGSAAK